MIKRAIYAVLRVFRLKTSFPVFIINKETKTIHTAWQDAKIAQTVCDDLNKMIKVKKTRR